MTALLSTQRPCETFEGFGILCVVKRFLGVPLRLSFVQEERRFLKQKRRLTVPQGEWRSTADPETYSTDFAVSRLYSPRTFECLGNQSHVRTPEL